MHDACPHASACALAYALLRFASKSVAAATMASLTIRVLRHAGEISPQVEQAIAEGDPDEARLAAFRARSG
jgi:hypothetical protein